MFKRWFKRRIGMNQDIDPDEIFLDSHNLPSFDRHQFEGRIEHPIDARALFVILALFTLVACVFVGRLWFLQVARGAEFTEQSENNRLRNSIVFAERGVIYDRYGELLAWNTPQSDEFFSKRAFIDAGGFSHVLGYVGYPARDSAGFYYTDEFTGRDGIEKIFDSTLKGKNGTLVVETNVSGEIIARNEIVPPQDGASITLSLDAELQAMLYESIEKVARERSYTGGAGVVMDVHTGELLAMVSYPEFSSSVMTEGDDTDVLSAYQNDPATPFLNRVVAGQYTPGSIVKPFMALGVLEEDLIDPRKSFYSDGMLEVPNPYDPDNPSLFADWKAHGWVDMRHALAVSSNVYFYIVGGGFGDQKGLGISRIEKYMRLFGFGEPTGVVFDGEASGVIPTPDWKKNIFDGDDWRLGDTYHTSIGQYGFQVTPLQAVRGAALVANGGTLLMPQIVKTDTPKEVRKVPIESEHIRIVQEGMREAVTEGTSTYLNVSFVEVAAKSGTAELGISKKFTNSWLIGFFPFDNPKYAFAFLMEHGPRENQIGSTLVVRDMIEWMRIHRPEYLN